ncbi:MAG: hypothetical protein GQ574_13615 [Crocinitomix sp.]|nr:hypothetical protein [Crocinitomix sp.]
MIRIGKPLLITMCVFLMACSNGENDSNIELTLKSFPKYEIVVEHFFEKYSIGKIRRGEEVHFEKKPTGWHVSILDYEKEREEVFNQIFWDVNLEDYVEVDFNLKTPNEDQLEVLDGLNDPWITRSFKLYPYYGYPGWNNDVIELLEDSNDLSDSLLNALARSYSTHASNLLSNNAGLVADDVTYDLPMTANALDDEQLANYRKYSDLAIDTYKRLVKQNPDFPVLVGSIGTKLANEHVTSFLDLRMFQNEGEAQKELEGCNYSEALIGMAKNSLISCDTNAILFTAGDNDTYPLLYVQSQLGFRQDVMILNLSLLNTQRYINHLRSKILEADAVPFSITQEQIDGYLRGYVYVNSSSVVEMELAEAMTFILDDNNAVDDFSYEVPIFEIPTSKLVLTGDKFRMPFELREPYIFRSGLMILDILATNKMERPIHFSSGNSAHNFVGLDSYLSYVGLTLKLGTSSKTRQSDESLHIDTDKLYENLVYAFDFSGLDDMNFHDERLLSNYSAVFHKLASALLSEGEVDKAQDVLFKWSSVIPRKRHYMDYAIPELIKDFYEAGLKDQGDELVDHFSHSLNTLLDGGTRKVLDDAQVQEIMKNITHLEKEYRYS